MKLGFSRINITPDFPVPMAGYFAENRISKGVHDKLYIRALFFDGAKNGSLVILQYDLLCLDNVCIDKIYGRLKNNTKDLPVLEKNQILFCAVHTHSGFGGIFDTEHGVNCELIPLFGENNPLLVELVVNKSIEAIAEAARNCVETTIRINKGIIEGLGTNRRRQDIPCDNSLLIMEFFRLDRKKILLYNLCCHPTVMNSKNLLLSADFPGAVAGKLEDIPGGYDMVVFINGSAGDMSTRFTRSESSFDECNRYANNIVTAIESIKKDVFFPLEKAELRYYALSLKKARPPDPKKARENLQNAMQNVKKLKSKNAGIAAIRKAASLVEGAQISLLKSDAVEKEETTIDKTVETGILRINNTVIICSPFELFSSLALILKEKKAVECFGYVNNLAGYLADCDAWDNLDYEALSSDFERGEGEHYIESVSNLI